MYGELSKQTVYRATLRMDEEEAQRLKSFLIDATTSAALQEHPGIFEARGMLMVITTGRLEYSGEVVNDD